jgi:hypothetical protein
LKVAGDGLLSVKEEDIDAEKTAVGMHQAEVDGYFGKDAVVWKGEQWPDLREMVAQGFEMSADVWGQSAPLPAHVEHRWREAHQSHSLTEVQHRPPPQAPRKPSPLMRHFLTQPNFKAEDVLSTVSGSES